MTAAAIAASSAREMVLVIPMHAFWVYIVENVSEGGIRLIRNLALLHSFGGCHHQCRSNPANLLPYGLGADWSCSGVLRQYYNYEVGQC